MNQITAYTVEETQKIMSSNVILMKTSMTSSNSSRICSRSIEDKQAVLQQEWKYEDDEIYQDIVQDIENDIPHRHYELIEGRLLYKNRICVPSDFSQEGNT